MSSLTRPLTLTVDFSPGLTFAVQVLHTQFFELISFLSSGFAYCVSKWIKMIFFFLAKNYLSWSQVMRSFLKDRMLLHYCTGAITIPVKGADEEDAAFLGRMIEWDSHNHMILTWI